MNKPSILIVDDDAYMYAVMNAVLENDYQISYAPDGVAALSALEGTKPDLILLDIEMSGMNGYDVCKTIKSSDEDNLPSILFVSAHSGADDRLKAYAVGADDFITKPLEPKELYHKVEQAMRARAEAENLRLSAREAMTVAMSAMTDSGALGTVLHFFRKLFNVQSPEDVATTLLNTIADYGLVGTVQIRGGGEVKTINSEGKPAMMDAVLMQNLAHEKQRIVEYGSRNVYNYGLVSLLVKNMPLGDPDQYGKYKDYLALLVEGAGERLRSLESEAMARLLSGSREVLADIDKRYKQQQQDTVDAFNELTKELEDALIFLGLTESQENTLMDIVRGVTYRVTDSYKRGLEIDQHLKQLLGDLKQAQAD